MRCDEKWGKGIGKGFGTWFGGRTKPLPLPQLSVQDEKT